MTRISDEIRQKVVRTHIPDGRTIAGLVAGYDISGTAVSNWICLNGEECQNNDEEKSKLEMMEELHCLMSRKYVTYSVALFIRL